MVPGRKTFNSPDGRGHGSAGSVATQVAPCGRPNTQSRLLKGDCREQQECDKLYEEGLRCYKKCFQHMKEHWSDFNMTDVQKKTEWKNLLLHFKHKILTMRISEMRAEIHALWAASYLSETDKRHWAAFEGADAECVDSTEMKLCKMREELARIRAYHDNHKELIRLVKKYEEAESSLDIMGQQSSAHDRLVNRGALLLKEEQHRSLLTKVPQMQKMILKMIKEKEMNGETFLIRGEHFQTIVDRNRRTFQMKPRYKQSMSLQRGAPIGTLVGGIGVAGGGCGGGAEMAMPRQPSGLSAIPHSSRRHQLHATRTTSSVSFPRRGYASS